MNTLKRYASRRLNELKRGGRTQKRWARHGSTIWLWKDRDVAKAIEYVADRQGVEMALFVEEARNSRTAL